MTKWSYTMCTVLFQGIPTSTDVAVITYHLSKTHYKCPKFCSAIMLLPVLLLTLLTTYFRFGGWMYTLYVLTNQNRFYMPKLNDIEIHYRIECVYVSIKCQKCAECANKKKLKYFLKFNRGNK